MTNTQAQDATFLTFDDDQALLAHILGITPAEELVDVPEWNVQILCRALSAEDRMAVQIAAYDEKTKRSDYRKSEALPLIVIGGCYNPATGKHVFTDSHRKALLHEQNGAAIERLWITILRLSGMIPGATDTKKN